MFLIFSDGTSFEIYGDFSWSTECAQGGLAEVKHYAEKFRDHGITWEEVGPETEI